MAERGGFWQRRSAGLLSAVFAEPFRSTLTAAALVLLLMAGAAAAHVEDPEESDVLVARDQWQGDVEVVATRLSGNGTHTHFGMRGNEICSGIERFGATAYGCGFFPRTTQDLSVGWGTSCYPHPNGWGVGVTSARVAKVIARYDDGARRIARLYPSPSRLRFDGQFWAIVHRGVPRLKRVRAIDRRGRTIGLQRRLRHIGDGADCPRD